MTEELDKHDLTYKLVAWVDLFKYECSHSEEVNWDDKDEQAYSQLKALIEGKVSDEFVEKWGVRMDEIIGSWRKNWISEKTGFIKQLLEDYRKEVMK